MCTMVEGRQNVFRSEVLASHCHCCEESKNQELYNRQLSDDNAAFLDSWRYLFATLPFENTIEIIDQFNISIAGAVQWSC